mgnify:CR=1 FL=1
MGVGEATLHSRLSFPKSASTAEIAKGTCVHAAARCTTGPIEKAALSAKRKTTTETALTIDPNDDTRFQPRKASGKSGIRRGIPPSPKKCCGKNVRFTPVKRSQK